MHSQYKRLYEWQQVSGPCTRLLQQIERSASQAVSASRDSKLHLSRLRVRRRGTGTRGKPRVMPARGGTEEEIVPVLTR